MGGATESLDIEQIAALVQAISIRPKGLAVSIDLLGMVVHSAHERGNQFVREAAAFTRDFLARANLRLLDTNDAMHDHHLEQLITFSLSNNEPGPVDRQLLESVLSWENSGERRYAHRRGRHLQPFFKFTPEMALDAIYRPDEDGKYNTAHILAANRDNDRAQRPISALRTDVALRWCAQSPEDRFTFIAETCLLYAPGDDSQKRLSELASSLFNAAPNKPTILRIYISRLMPMSWSGSRAAKLRGRFSVLDDIDAHGDQAIAQMIADERVRLDELAARMEQEEAAEESTRNATFE
jgi:hypothetical protein